MSFTYNLTLTDGTPLVDINSLESNGFNSESVPRQVLGIQFLTGTHTFEVADDVTSRFIPGFQFNVLASAYSGLYTVHASGPTYTNGKTLIPVVETIAATEYSVWDVSQADDYWRVLSVGDGECAFYPTSTFEITGNALPAANTTYTVVSSASSETNAVVGVVTGAAGKWTVLGDQTAFYTAGTTFQVRSSGGDGLYTVVSSVLSGTDTEITVVEPIPGTATTAGAATLSPAVTIINVTPGSIPVGTPDGGAATPSSPTQYAFSAPPAIILVSAGIYDITWRIAGDHTAKFLTDCSFLVKDNSFYSYQTFVITNVSFSTGMTHITARVRSSTTPTPDGTGSLTHPVPAAPYGYIQYAMTNPATPLKLMGRGVSHYSNNVSWGNALQHNLIHMVEHFSNDTPPLGPLPGQLWFDKTVNSPQAFTLLHTFYPVVNVTTGLNGVWFIAGDFTAEPTLQAGKQLVVYGNVGNGHDSEIYTIDSTVFNAGNTEITVTGTIPGTATPNGTLYAYDDWYGVVMARLPVLGFIDMNNNKIINLDDATDPLDALNLQTGDFRYVNFDGDTMTGTLIMSGAANIQFTAGSTGDILLQDANDIVFSGTGDILLQSTNDIVFSGTGIINMGNNKITNLADATDPQDALNLQTGDTRYVNFDGDTMTGTLIMSLASDINFPLGSTGNITLDGTNDIIFSGVGVVDMGTNFIVNLASPVNGTDAVNKAYVDAFVSGIMFITPLLDPDVYNDSLDTPPVTPEPYHRTYIVKPSEFTINGVVTGLGGTWIISGNHAARFAPGDTFVVDGNTDPGSDGTYTISTATDVAATTELVVVETIPGTAAGDGFVYHSVGDWNGFDGHALVYDGIVWLDVLERPVQDGDRFGIYAEPDNDEVPVDTSGMNAFLITHLGKVGTIQPTVVGPAYADLGTASAWSFYTPVEPDAFSVVGLNSLHFGHSYTFRGTHGTGAFNDDYKWIEFSGPASLVDGAGLKYNGNILNVGAGSAITVTADAVSVEDNPTLPGTESVTLTIGTTAQRPLTPVEGMLRYNSTLTKFEGYENAVWRDVITADNTEVTNGNLVFGAADDGVVTSSDNLTFGIVADSAISHTSGNFVTAGDARTVQYMVRNITTDNTPTELFIDGTTGTLRMVLNDNTTWKFEVHVVARRTDATDEGAAYKFDGCIDRNTGAASTALVGSTIKTIIAEDTIAWDVDVTADATNGSLLITVTGENAKTIRWVAFVRTVEVSA